MANRNPAPHARFQPGRSGNPGGKPKGARNRVTAAFLQALAGDFDAHGEEAIRRCRQRDPGRYLAIVASLIPKQVQEVTPLEEISDAELAAGIALLRAQLARGSDTDATAPSTEVH